MLEVGRGLGLEGLEPRLEPRPAPRLVRTASHPWWEPSACGRTGLAAADTRSESSPSWLGLG